MSSLSSSVILSAISVMEKQLALLRAQLGEASVAAPAKAAPAKEKKAAKKEEKKPRAPTAWLLFTERVRGLLREADYPPKALGPEMTKFCSELKKDNGDLASWASEDILARRAAWSAPESKLPSAPASVVSDAAEAAEEEAKPVKKARKSAKKPAASEDEAAPASDGEASSEKKKRVWSPEAKARELGAYCIDLPALHETSMRKIDRQNTSFWAAVHDRNSPDCLGMLERQRVKTWLRNAYASFDTLPL